MGLGGYSLETPLRHLRAIYVFTIGNSYKKPFMSYYLLFMPFVCFFTHFEVCLNREKESSNVNHERKIK